MRRMRRQAENNNNNNKTDRQDPNKPHSTEVFDSSRYDAMDDMTKGSTMTDQLPDKQRAMMMDVQTKEPLDPGEIANQAIVGEATPEPSDARINPMMTEERARTKREINEEMATSASSPPDAGMEENAREEEVRVIEHKSDGYYDAIPELTTVMMRQYAEMATAGMRLYGQFLKSSADTARLWFGAWWPWL